MIEHDISKTREELIAEAERLKENAEICAAKECREQLCEAKALAFDEAAKMVWDWTYMKRVGGADVDLVESIKARAAELRSGL